MESPHNTATVAASPKAASQFSLRSLLVTTLTCGMLLAYVRMFGEEGVSFAIGGLLMAGLSGALLGWAAGRFLQTLTWSLVGTSLILCCVLSAGRLDSYQVAWWLVVGSIISTVAGVLPTGNMKLRLASAIGLWLIVSAALTIFGEIDLLWFDWLLALPVALGVMLLVEAVSWLQAKYHTALDMWAAGLVFAVIAGNFGAVVIWNLWYR